MWGLEIAVIFTTTENLPRKGRDDQSIEANFKKLAVVVKIHDESVLS